MITVYRQDLQKPFSKWCYKYTKSDDGVSAIRWGIENKKLIPGDLAVTIHTDEDGIIIIGKTVKHWAIYRRHGQIEAVPDRIGVQLTSTSYRYYREYLKFGRFKSIWYKIRKKRG